MSEQDMWGAVLQQAIVDANLAFTLADDQTHFGLSRPERVDAKNFITATYGPWARSRLDICHVSGVDPDAFFDRCAQCLKKHGDLREMLAAANPLTDEEKRRRKRVRMRSRSKKMRAA
jgi:hypothetical protein